MQLSSCIFFNCGGLLTSFAFCCGIQRPVPVELTLCKLDWTIDLLSPIPLLHQFIRSERSRQQLIWSTILLLHYYKQPQLQAKVFSTTPRHSTPISPSNIPLSFLIILLLHHSSTNNSTQFPCLLTNWQLSSSFFFNCGGLLASFAFRCGIQRLVLSVLNTTAR